MSTKGAFKQLQQAELEYKQAHKTACDDFYASLSGEGSNPKVDKSFARLFAADRKLTAAEQKNASSEKERKHKQTPTVDEKQFHPVYPQYKAL